jgi:hypothetical protein
MAFRDIDRVRLYRVRAQDGDMIERCKLHAGKRTIVLQSMHIAAWCRVEDRRTAYEAFVRELLIRVAHANRGATISAGAPWPARLGWYVTLLLVAALGLAGVVQLATRQWEGLWLVGMAVTTGPLAVAMAREKPARGVSMEEVEATQGLGELLD